MTGKRQEEVSGREGGWPPTPGSKPDLNSRTASPKTAVPSAGRASRAGGRTEGPCAAGAGSRGGPARAQPGMLRSPPPPEGPPFGGRAAVLKRARSVRVTPVKLHL